MASSGRKTRSAGYVAPKLRCGFADENKTPVADALKRAPAHRCKEKPYGVHGTGNDRSSVASAWKLAYYPETQKAPAATRVGASNDRCFDTCRAITIELKWNRPNGSHFSPLD
jgi:hypothetical protein